MKSVSKKLISSGYIIKNNPTEHRIDYQKETGFGIRDFNGQVGLYFGENDTLQRIAIDINTYSLDEVDDYIIAFENHFGTPTEKIDKFIIMGIRSIDFVWEKTTSTIELRGVGSHFKLILFQSG